MLLLEQLQLSFESSIISCPRDDRAVAGHALRLPGSKMAPGPVALQSHRTPSLQQDVDLAQQARKLLRVVGASQIAAQVRVEWNARLKTCAGHADYRKKLISLNPRLRDHGFSEIDRTIRHELAHLVAQSRAGRRRILPHGPEWRAACRDLGIGDEVRCHSLPFPVSTRARRYVYKCPNCFLEFPRVRRIRRATACLACCRAHNHGRFHAKFRLQLVPANGCLARTRT